MTQQVSFAMVAQAVRSGTKLCIYVYMPGYMHTHMYSHTQLHTVAHNFGSKWCALVAVASGCGSCCAIGGIIVAMWLRRLLRHRRAHRRQLTAHRRHLRAHRRWLAMAASARRTGLLTVRGSMATMRKTVFWHGRDQWRPDSTSTSYRHRRHRCRHRRHLQGRLPL